MAERDLGRKATEGVTNPVSDAEADTEVKTVLVVEDEILIRMMIADELALAGFYVVQAASADEALRVLQSRVAVDLILTDINMPGSMDGLSLAARVRSGWPQIKIFVTSGHLQVLPKDAPAEMFFPKPYRPEVVCTMIRQFMRMDGHDEK